MKKSKHHSTHHQAKIVVIGDGGCGKTSLLIRFCKDEFPTTYIPTVFDTECTEMEIDDKHITLKLWDTAGQEEYDALRRLSYPDTDVCIICFSIDRPDSTTNVYEKWVPEVHHHTSMDIPIILVGCKMDQRTCVATIEELKQIDEQPVTSEQGMELSKRIGASAYIECSALTCEGIRQVFEACARCALRAKAQKKSTGLNKFTCCMGRQ